MLRFGIGVRGFSCLGVISVGLGIVCGRFWIRLAFVNSVGLAVRKAGWDIWDAFSLVERMAWSEGIWFHGMEGVMIFSGQLLLDMGYLIFWEDIGNGSEDIIGWEGSIENLSIIWNCLRWRSLKDHEGDELSRQVKRKFLERQFLLCLKKYTVGNASCE